MQEVIRTLTEKIVKNIKVNKTWKAKEIYNQNNHITKEKILNFIKMCHKKMYNDQVGSI